MYLPMPTTSLALLLPLLFLLIPAFKAVGLPFIQNIRLSSEPLLLADRTEYLLLFGVFVVKLIQHDSLFLAHYAEVLSSRAFLVRSVEIAWHKELFDDGDWRWGCHGI